MADPGVKISRKKIRSAAADPAHSAKAAGLRYIKNGSSGYSRVRKGKSFIYFDGKKRLNDKSELERIKKLVIPPAWKDVWICSHPNGHLQATGIDAAGRKQYKYHKDWCQIRSQTKYYRLREFGTRLPRLRREIRKNLKLPGFEKDKIISALLAVQEKTNIRIGNAFYEKLYGSFGMTTLRNRHVKIRGTKIRFEFKGKKGVKHHITLVNRKLARILKGCREIPGKELFEYIDEDDNIHTIDSGMVNNFIQEVTGKDFTTKDFRTWAGSINALKALKKIGGYETKSEMNENLNQMLEMVSGDLGNTKAVCKKYYIHPRITELYEKKKLDKYFPEVNGHTSKKSSPGLNAGEKALMKILK